MSEKLPHADKLVGLPTEHAHHQQAWENHAVDRFENDRAKEKFGELKKTKRDIEIINFVTQSLDEYLEKFGRQKNIEVDLNNIHLFSSGGVQQYLENGIEGGAHSAVTGGVLVDRRTSDVDFALVLFHELLHMKAYKVLQVIPGDLETNPRIDTYRSGFSVTSRDGKTRYFEDLEEAIVSLMEERFFNDKVILSPIFSEQIDYLVKTPIFSRQREKEILSQLIDDIWEAKPEGFSSKDDIENLFIKTQINGNLHPVAKLVESVFGRGSFRRLGEWTKQVKD